MECFVTGYETAVYQVVGACAEARGIRCEEVDHLGHLFGLAGAAAYVEDILLVPAITTLQWFSSANFMDRLSNSGERIAPVQTVLTWMSLHERVGSEQLNSSASSMATYLIISTEPTFLPLAMIFRTETTPIPVVPLVIKVVLLFYDSY